MPPFTPAKQLIGLWRRIPGERRTTLLALALYILLTILLTYPTFFKLGTVVYGYFSDGPVYVWKAWWRWYTLKNGLDYRFFSLSQAPFGTHFVLRESVGMTFTSALLSAIFGPIPAFNLMRLAGYVLSGFLTYVLACQLVKNRPACFVAGLVFAFAPYAVSHTQQHLGLAQQWLIPLNLLALIGLRRRQTWQAALLLGGAFALTAYMLSYYAYYVVIASLLFALIEGIAQYRAGGWRAALNIRRLSLYGLAALAGLVLYLPELLPGLRVLYDPPQDPLRPIGPLSQANDWFYWLSTRPWDFVLPSVSNPIFARPVERVYTWFEHIGRLDFSPPIVERHVADMYLRWYWLTTEKHIYLGIANLLVGGYAIWQWRKGGLNESQERISERRLWVGYFLALFVVALLFSSPPYIPIGALFRKLWTPLHNIVIPMPSLITLWFFKPARDSTRFVTLAMIALAVLVAVGLDLLLSRLDRPSRRWLLLAGFVGVLTIEFAHVPVTQPFHVPEEYAWLAGQPRGTIVAVYPLNNTRQTMYQYVHELPLVDASMAVDAGLNYDNLNLTEVMALANLEAPGTVLKLAALGTRYVVNTSAPLSPPPAGLSLLFTTETAQVFEVSAEPVPLVVLYTPRDGALWTSPAAWGWQGDAYTMYIWNPLSEAQMLDIELTISGAFRGAQLEALRTLTPHPDQIIRWGIRVDNPAIPPDYPETPAQAEAAPGGAILRALVIQPGETTLTLRWAGGESEVYPEVTGIHIAFVPVLQ